MFNYRVTRTVGLIFQNFNKYSAYGADLKAGISVAFLAIPQAIAYSGLVGIPVVNGLLAAMVPTIVAALSGSSTYLSTGPVAVLSLLTFSFASGYSKSGSIEYLYVVGLLAVMVGIFQIIMGLLKMGEFTKFIAHPVVSGFVSAAAIIITLTQLPKFLGFESSSEVSLLSYLVEIISNYDQIYFPALIVGSMSLLMILWTINRWPNFPSVIAVVSLMSLYSMLFNYSGQIVGSINLNLPELIFIFNWELIKDLIFPAFTIALIGYMEGISVAKRLAIKSQQELDANKELISQGMGNLTSGLLQGMPVSGSFARTALNYSSGAVSRMSSVFAGIFTLLLILVIAPGFYYLPVATLAAVIVSAVIKLINPVKFKSLFAVHPKDGIVAIATFVATLIFTPHLEYGLLSGIAVSVLIYMYRIANPNINLINLSNHNYEESIYRFDKYLTNKQVLAVAVDRSICFANAENIKSQIMEFVDETNSDIRYIVILGKGINHIDASGEEVLEFLSRLLEQRGIKLLLTGLHDSVVEQLKLSNFYSELGSEAFFSRANLALEYISNRD